MALLTHLEVDRTGLADALVAAAGGGDTYKLDDDKSILVVHNGGGSSVTVTVATTLDVDGLDVPDRTLAVPAGQYAFLPLIRGLYRDSADGLCDITYSGTTSVKVGVIRTA
jgi:hypothetical protein